LSIPKTFNPSSKRYLVMCPAPHPTSHTMDPESKLLANLSKNYSIIFFLFHFIFEEIKISLTARLNDFLVSSFICFNPSPKTTT
jgi:hypothetical protein